jgi:hypothetical protein
MRVSLHRGGLRLDPENWEDWREVLRLWKEMSPDAEAPETRTGGGLSVSTCLVRLEDAKALK